MELKAFAEEFNVNYPMLIGDGRDGKICTQHTGFASKEQFELEIKALL